VFYTPGASQSSSFPSYIFWGGLSTGNTATFGAGQYVMAGVNNSASGATVFTAGGTVQTDGLTGTTTGTMFIFTDGNYPGLQTQLAGVPFQSGNMPVLFQGSLGFKNAQLDLYGLQNSTNSGSSLPAAMDVYSGIVWWQDRRNSTDGYSEPSGTDGCTAAACTGDNGSVVYCNNSSCPGGTVPAAMTSANHVTATSPGVTLDPGNVKLGLYGVYYQPRGAWLELQHGNAGVSCGGSACPLQVITGALIEDTGDTTVTLAGPTNPVLKYNVALLQ
jgi:hypothetical protein